MLADPSSQLLNGSSMNPRLEEKPSNQDRIKYLILSQKILEYFANILIFGLLFINLLTKFYLKNKLVQNRFHFKSRILRKNLVSRIEILTIVEEKFNRSIGIIFQIRLRKPNHIRNVLCLKFSCRCFTHGFFSIISFRL